MMQTTVPAEHQALGRKAKGFSRSKWDERKDNDNLQSKSEKILAYMYVIL
jgi:predicted NAD-dependent protein-ADP-ribosyltransferase YbiA (DUF1768 family)